MKVILILLPIALLASCVTPSSRYVYPKSERIILQPKEGKTLEEIQARIHENSEKVKPVYHLPMPQGYIGRPRTAQDSIPEGWKSYSYSITSKDYKDYIIISDGFRSWATEAPFLFIGTGGRCLGRNAVIDGPSELIDSSGSKHSMIFSKWREL